MLFQANNYYFPNYQQTKDERATDRFLTLIGMRQGGILYTAEVDAGLLAASILLYPPHVKHLGLAKGSWRLSVDVCSVLCRCGALVSIVCIIH